VETSGLLGMAELKSGKEITEAKKPCSLHRFNVVF
jgi:hypothetical protein